MILPTHDSPVESNVNEVRKCNIQANPIMYDILSNKLYKNKIRAVIRELSTNANDAQKAAGNNDKAITVHLPTLLEPFLAIRDYGIGLSDEDIYDLYMTYGASSKRESNLFNGALGVGSKSPFAYAKSFSVMSYYNGNLTTYSVYSKDGEPVVAKMGESKTNEPNGLQVKVPVNTDDFDNFLKEASYVYTFFDGKIDINRELKPLFKDSKVLLKGTIDDIEWSFMGSNNNPAHNPGYSYYHQRQQQQNKTNGYIVMAGVGYPLTSLDPSKYPVLSSSSVLLKVPTGSVEFAASREELSMSNITYDALKKIENKIISSIELELNKKLKKDTSIFEQIQIINNLPVDIKKIYAQSFSKTMRDKFSITVSNTGDCSIDLRDTEITIQSGLSTYATYNSFPSQSLKEFKDARFVILDVPSRQKVIYDMENIGDNSKIYFIHTNVSVQTFRDDKGKRTGDNRKIRFQKLLDKFPDLKFKWSSDYELGTNTKGGSKARGTTKYDSYILGKNNLIAPYSKQYLMSQIVEYSENDKNIVIPLPTVRGAVKIDGVDGTYYGFAGTVKYIIEKSKYKYDKYDNIIIVCLPKRIYDSFIKKYSHTLFQDFFEKSISYKNPSTYEEQIREIVPRISNTSYYNTRAMTDKEVKKTASLYPDDFQIIFNDFVKFSKTKQNTNANYNNDRNFALLTEILNRIDKRDFKVNVLQEDNSDPKLEICTKYKKIYNFTKQSFIKSLPVLNKLYEQNKI